jgi:hypothetical protein
MSFYINHSLICYTNLLFLILKLLESFIIFKYFIIMIFLKLLNYTNKYLISLDIFITLLINSNSIEMMDIFKTLFKLDNFMLFFSKYFHIIII